MSKKIQDGSVRIALEQRDMCVGDIAGNAEKIARAVKEARGLGAGLVVFPELALTGYPPEDLLLRDDFLRAVEDALARLATLTEGADVVVGAPVRENGAKNGAKNGALYNSAVWLRNGRIHARYDKRCLPNYGVFDERRYFKPGEATGVVELAGLRIGLTVCEDLWMEPAASLADMRGEVDIVINCSASPFHLGKASERDNILAQRTHELMAPIAYVNLVGGQDELVFDGDSRVVGADGKTMGSAGQFIEGRVLCDLAPGKIGCAEKPAKRPDETEAMWCAIKLGLRDYLDKSGFDNAVVGISGGIDSALVLSLLSEVIDGTRIYALMLPSPYTSEMSLEDARKVADACGANYRELSIDPVFEVALQQLGSEFKDAPTDITGQNLQSRIRGLLLMAYANKHDALLVTTGNKSEMAVGYATLYGDMAGAFAPLKDISKTRVYELAEYCNRSGERIPRRIIERPPSAELAPGQTDSQSLPSYDAIDEVVEKLVESDVSSRDLASHDLTSDEVKRVQAMVYASEYKRRQSPPGPRITKRAFGKDRRYPIVSRFRGEP